MDSVLSARGPDQHPVADDQRRHGNCLPRREIRNLGLPQFAAGLGVHRDGATVKQVVDDFSLGVDGAAVHRIATGHAHRGGVHIRTVLEPKRVVFFAEVETRKGHWDTG